MRANVKFTRDATHDLLADFKPLSEAGRLTLLKRYFPEVELTIEAAEKLARMDGLTPGDFKAVSTRMRFYQRLTVDIVVEGLQSDCVYREGPRRIGF